MQRGRSPLRDAQHHRSSGTAPPAQPTKGGSGASQSSKKLMWRVTADLKVCMYASWAIEHHRPAKRTTSGLTPLASRNVAPLMRKEWPTIVPKPLPLRIPLMRFRIAVRRGERAVPQMSFHKKRWAVSSAGDTLVRFQRALIGQKLLKSHCLHCDSGLQGRADSYGRSSNIAAKRKRTELSFTQDRLPSEGCD
jgi:hypothetical protein